MVPGFETLTAPDSPISPSEARSGVRDSFVEPIVDLSSDVSSAAALAALPHDVLAQVRQAICITDTELDTPGPTIRFVNQAYLDIFACEEADVVGQSPRFAQGPLTSRSVLDRIRSHLDRGDSTRAQAINYRIDRTPFRLRWSIDAVRRDGRPVAFLAVLTDVTVEDRMRRRLAALDNLLDGVQAGDLAGGPDQRRAEALARALEPVLAELASATVRVGDATVELSGPEESRDEPLLVPVGDVGAVEIRVHPDADSLLDRIAIDEVARHARWLFERSERAVG